MDACHMLKLARNMLQVNDDRCRPFCTIYASAAKSYLNIVFYPFAHLWLDVMIIILLYLFWAVTDSYSAGIQSNCDDHRTDPLEVHQSSPWSAKRMDCILPIKLQTSMSTLRTTRWGWPWLHRHWVAPCQWLSAQWGIFATLSSRTVRQRQNSLR